MKKKTDIEKIEQRVKELENEAGSGEAFDSSPDTFLKKPDTPDADFAQVEIAVDVLDDAIETAKPVEQALIAEHIFRRAIEDSIPCGISGIDLKGNQIYVNQAFCTMVGWSRDELIDKAYPFAYWPCEVIDTIAADFKPYIGGKFPEDGIELPFVRKTGEIFWGLVIGTYLRDSQGEIMGNLISVYDITVRRSISEALRESEKKLRLLSTRLIEAQETERRLIAREVHDSLGGNLAAIKYDLEKKIHVLETSNAAGDISLDNVFQMVKNTIREAQRISKNLHPSILDDLGLLAAIRSFCREFQGVYSGIEIQFDIRIQEDDIPDLLKIMIYRVVQEAMNNIAKHSGADKVRLALVKSEHHIELGVEDNGHGFDPYRDEVHKANAGRKMGIENMRERAELFNGSFVIKTTSGKGTLIRAIWPCL